MADNIRELLRETLSALEHFDGPALERLLQRAEQMSALDADVDRISLASAKTEYHALYELLAATDRNLKMLRRLRGDRVIDGRAEWVL
jgi:hypothetical protein